MTDQEHFDRINNMSQEEMARLWRFCPSGHPYFDRQKPFWAVFNERFKLLGCFTSAISKEIGW